MLYQGISFERSQSTIIYNGHIDWTCHSSIWNKLYGKLVLKSEELHGNDLLFQLQAALDNGPAQLNLTSQKLQAAGEEVGDPFEISTVRREVRSQFLIATQ